MVEKDSLTEDETLHGKWYLMYKKLTDGVDVTSLDLSDMDYIHAPKQAFYADPFGVKAGESYQVFFERFDYKRGYISCFDIDDKTISDVSLGVDVHLSFPNVFMVDGKYYMIPESCHLDKVNIYECVQFPNTWNLRKTIIHNVHSGDNQLLYKDGKWWIFNITYHEQNNFFCVWYSDDLLGTWKPHAKLNVHNKRMNHDITRGAGRIFVDVCGRLIRPAQYSRRGINGEGVILYEINVIDENEYDETAVEIIVPSIVGARAVHTFSVCDGLMLMDGRGERSTDFPYVDIDVQAEIQIINEINKM